MTGPPNIESLRARSFGAVAANYDRYRPRYPDQLVDDVVAMLPGRRVLEVGAGTGIATAAFAARGMAVACVEPDPEMAAVLSAKLTADADLSVVVATFEDWPAARPADAPGFDGLISGQAWHWTDPETHWTHAGAALRSGGVMALFWNDDDFADPRIAPAITTAYGPRGIGIRPIHEKPAPSTEPDNIVIRPREGWPEAHAELDEYFTDLRTHRYHWTRRMSVVDYVAQLNTTSAHLVLPPEVRDDMTAELIATLTGYGDEIELTMSTELDVAVRR